MINAALNLVPGAVGQGRPQIIPAVVCQNTTQTPLPTGFNQPLFVTNPANSGYFWQVADWPASQGGSLPLAGATVALFYDSNRTLRVVWWDGKYTPPGLLVPTALTTPTITVGTPRQPSTARPVNVVLSFAFTIVGAQSEAYTVKIGSSSPPTTQIGSPQLTASSGSATMTSAPNVTFMLPVGWWYEVNQVTHTGASIITATEMVL